MDTSHDDDFASPPDAVDEEISSSSDDISASITDLHALAAFGELQSLESALRSQSSDPSSLAALLNHQDESGLTLLHSAAQSGQPHVVDALLSLGADSCVQDVSGLTPLHLSSGGGYEAVVRSLLSSFTPSHGCLDWQDSAGRTALHWASGHNHDAVVQALIAAGANPSIKDHKGQTASAAFTTPAVSSHSPPLTVGSLRSHLLPLPLVSLVWTTAFKSSGARSGA